VVEIIYDPEFKRNFQKLKNKETKDRIIKQIAKIKNNPDIGKPMRYGRKGTRELYITPWRLSYCVEGEMIYILALYHKDTQ